ncbi:MAG: 2-amino-4-hydroxy-6-hydroxymethyldihydropteridine diphosphokinase [Zetaproteobacteria bacterium]|nr:2-amino-4-hydroxy-6-hydroxymethyldihydropteridine diphosphokinase [Zetaproteobacteria bacterium]
MNTALLGMGSNIEPEKHLLEAAHTLRQKFPSICFSNVYQSKAVGMDGDDFLNACCLIYHVPEKEGLLACLKGIEDDYGRDRSKGSWKPRTLDLDLLMYAGVILDDDIYRYAHVFVPASELISIKLPEAKCGIVKQLDLRL